MGSEETKRIWICEKLIIWRDRDIHWLIVGRISQVDIMVEELTPDYKSHCNIAFASNGLS